MWRNIMMNGYSKFSLRIVLLLSGLFFFAVAIGQPTSGHAKAIEKDATTRTDAAAAAVSTPTTSSTAAISPSSGDNTAVSSGATAQKSETSAAAEKKSSEPSTTTNPTKESEGVAHWDSSPSIFSKSDKIVGSKDLAPNTSVNRFAGKNSEASSVSLRCYKNFCLVKDVRKIPVHAGLNTVELMKLYAGLMPDSLSFRTPKKGRINVLSHTFQQKNLTSQSLFLSSIGSEVFFRLDDNSQNLDKGVLMAVSNEGGVSYAVIGGRDQKCFIVPLKQCVALDGSKKKSIIDQDSLLLSFESEESGDIDVEVSYLTKNITWKYVCIIDVFERFDRIDVFSQAFVKNNSGFDLHNIPIVFDTSVSSIEGMKPSAEANKTTGDVANPSAQHMPDSTASSYSKIFSVKNNSSSVCVLQSTKEIKPTMEYAARFPKYFFDEQSSSEISLPINNLLIVDNAKKICVDSADANSYAVIFHRIGDDRSFVSKQMVSSIKKENRLVLEIGKASGIIASARQTDFKRLSETQLEYGVCVSLKNEKAYDAAVLITADLDVPWNVTKTNFEMQKSENPAWRIELEAGELKELHYRIRITKKDKKD
jgi:hypothetical protein